MKEGRKEGRNGRESEGLCWVTYKAQSHADRQEDRKAGMQDRKQVDAAAVTVAVGAEEWLQLHRLHWYRIANSRTVRVNIFVRSIEAQLHRTRTNEQKYWREKEWVNRREVTSSLCYVMSCFNHRTHSDYIQYWQSCAVQCSVVQYLSFTFYSLSHSSTFLFSSPLVPFFSLFPIPSLLTSLLYYNCICHGHRIVYILQPLLFLSFIASYTILSLIGPTDGDVAAITQDLRLPRLIYSCSFISNLTLFTYLHTFTDLISIFHF